MKKTFIICLCLLLSGCASVQHTAKKPVDTFYGKASYYGKELNGNKTASGETFDMNKLTAAHKTLDFGTRLKVTNLSNGRYVVVRINDRGPFVKGRVLDLSYAAAKKLDMISSGVTEIRADVL